MDLINSQLILIDKIKNLIKKSKNKGLPVFKIATFYFAPYGNSKGYAKIIFEQNKFSFFETEMHVPDYHKVSSFRDSNLGLLLGM